MTKIHDKPKGDISGTPFPDLVWEEIASYLDEESLFELGRACRSLNDFAFTFYLETQNEYYTFGDLLSAPVGYPPSLLTALRCALFVKGLRRIIVGPKSVETLQELIQQLLDLRAIVRRQTRCHHFALFLSSVDFRIQKCGGLAFARGIRVSETAFQELLCSLVTTAVNKGCKSLDISKGTALITGGALGAGPLTRPSYAKTKEQAAPVTIEPGPKEGPQEAMSKGPGASLPPLGSQPQALKGPRPEVELPGRARHSLLNLKRLFQTGFRKKKPKPMASLSPTLTTTPASAFSSSLNPTPTPIPPSAFSAPVRPDVVSSSKKDIALVPRPAEPGPSLTSQTHGPASQPSLSNLELRSDMLLLPLFYDFTSTLLRASSSTLSKLVIECSSTPSSVWHDFFTSVQISCLRMLEIIVSMLLVEEMLDIAPDDLAYFLSRHTTLEVITLYGLKPGVPSQALTERLFMPGLRSFRGHPAYVSWILDLDPAQVPRLERVVANTEYYSSSSNRPFDHRLLDGVLQSLGARNLTLGLDLTITEGRDEWFQSRVDDPDSGPIKSLTNIRTLDLNYSWYMVLKPPELEFLTQFINTFPAVEHLLLNEFAIDVESTGWALSETEKVQDFFARRCPSLRTVKINGRLSISLVPVSVMEPGSNGPQ
ncbi:hypothetical protein CC1G_04634 [Coprinopsis cinerea okayama7|uniref:F-box domain-containing protein n=1 Tax=Coprinopsis cinerea (strain Okayama-7 / 130 / ATCC MYA-4618 / FGSC 9003) TaxID=240176 RepID=A8N4U5_COPC7|nr:hypothetical protein CC1G_04634 [Coprinopsis cinerea okayama7\|eukprot:XP_001829945.1 hypothetical protein CC1G_04634 [Coprinopsis cinerea okayama7\